ncbi:MAG: hypothetical protein HY233_09250, partial [Acidobacteriales bacterium]|nr:hypothetical protein [Terriglobales bacterium]
RGLSPTAEIATLAAGNAAALATALPHVPPPATSPSQVATLAATPASPRVTAIPATPMPPPQSGGHRGLYMTMGALIVLAGLVAAGIYLPKKGNADERVPKAASNPAPTPALAEPAATTPPVQETAVPDNSAPPKPPVVLAGEAAKIQAHQDQPATSAAPPSGPNLHELEDEIDHLSARAGAVNSGLDRLKQQQAAAGYGLRGDMAERQESMKINLSRAQDAAEHGDAAKAKKYADRTQADLEALEKFLGR